MLILKWVLLLAGVVALFVMAGGAVPTTSEAVPQNFDCDGKNANHPLCPTTVDPVDPVSCGSEGLVVVGTGGPETYGETTIKWRSSCENLDYILGETITMEVVWEVVAGAAKFDGIAFKDKNGCTPKDGDNESALCSALSAPAPEDVPDGATSADVSFEFTSLHCDKKKYVEIGNAHLMLNLQLDVDDDGLDPGDPVLGFGVNVHVEDPHDAGALGVCVGPLT